METIVVDVFESQTVEIELSKTLKVMRHNLVHEGLADFYWYCGHRVTLEHKTMEQVLQEMGGRLDTQLRRYSQNAEEVGLIIDGFATPRPNEPACDLWSRSKTRGVFYKRNRPAKHSWEALQAYLWRLRKEGFLVYEAPDLESMCLALSAFVYNSVKPEHKTLKHYRKVRPVLWTPNPYVETLIGIGGTRIGEITANKILAKYQTPFRAFLANSADGDWPAGEAVYRQIQKGIGRIR